MRAHMTIYEQAITNDCFMANEAWRAQRLRHALFAILLKQSLMIARL